MLENGIETSAIGDLQGVLPQTDNISQYTEEQDTDSHDSDVMVSDALRESRLQENWFSQL